jgi:hypothetical protein
MTDHRLSTPKYSVMSNDNSGLEPVPISGLESAATHAQSVAYYQQEKEAYASSAAAWSVGAEEANTPVDGQAAEKPRILGLSVWAFWTVVVLLVVVLAGAIGGGVGGGMAARSRDASDR